MGTVGNRTVTSPEVWKLPGKIKWGIFVESIFNDGGINIKLKKLV